MRIIDDIVAFPPVWNTIQKVLGAPEFKRKLYRSVLHPPGPLLDFGCASGHIADAFTTFDYYGLDIDVQAVAAARKRFKQYPNMHFIAADIHARPFSRNFFGEILFATTFHHLDDQLLASILRELHCCLKPGGTIHVFDPVFQDKDGWQQRLVRRLDRGRYPRTLPQIRDIILPLHLYELQPHSFHPPQGALLQDCDFLYLPLRKPQAGQS